jgi:hypothetical protein
MDHLGDLPIVKSCLGYLSLLADASEGRGRDLQRPHEIVGRFKVAASDGFLVLAAHVVNDVLVGSTAVIGVAKTLVSQER